MTLPGLVSCEAFVPHTLQHLTEKRVFPSPLPEAFYNNMIRDYQALKDVVISRIVYESDDLRVTGLMALPKRVQQASQPLLIYNRGGSREYGKLTLLSVMRSMVPFAKQGYLVFASNYRNNDGSEGREEFGGADVDDVLNLLAMAQKHPAFDGRNTYMLGHSRGGMMTGLAIRRGAKLNAAIIIAGLFDLFAMAQSETMETNLLQRLIPQYQEHKEAVLTARSVLSWPQDMKVPLLLLHGDADEVISVSQSIALAQKLSEYHLPHELEIYPNGNHALVRHWDAVIARCLEWMERYHR